MKHISFRLICSLVLISCSFARAQYSIQYFDDNPPPVAPTAGQSTETQPGSLGQQPFPNQQDVNPTASQTNTHQLNQLFQFETTPDMCAKGESYISTRFDFLKYPGTDRQYRYQIQGQYAFTDQIAVGGFVPGITAKTNKTDTGMGDVTLYGQYKLDQFINPDTLDLTVQLDMILPTGDSSKMRDTGKFGVRPMLLAYKDFGQHGPGFFSVYALGGFTITTNSDIRLGAAATYQINEWIGIFEFYDQDGIHGHPLVQITPGISYRGLANWEFTVGVPVGVSKGTPDWGIIAKITYGFAN
jgi:hypothetical protein